MHSFRVRRNSNKTIKTIINNNLSPPIRKKKEHLPRMFVAALEVLPPHEQFVYISKTIWKRKKGTLTSNNETV